MYPPIPRSPQGRSNADLPLEGAKVLLEELKESLSQREREITELLESEASPLPAESLPPCTTLLRSVIQKVILTFLLHMLPSDSDSDRQCIRLSRKYDKGDRRY